MSFPLATSNPRRRAGAGRVGRLTAVAVAVALGLSTTAAGAGSGPTVSTTITIPTAATCADQTTGPMKGAVSPDGVYAYVTLNGDGRIAKIETATDTVVGLACTGARYPEHVAVSPDGSVIYVTNSASSVLRVLNAADLTTVADLSVGNAGNGVEVVTTPAGVGKVYVFRHMEGSLVVIDAADHSVDATVSVGTSTTRRAKGVASSTDGSTVYALVDAGVAVISTASDTVTATIPLSGAMGVAVAPDGSYLYVVGGSNNDSLFRVTTGDGSVSGPVVIGAAPSGVAFTPDGTQAVVSLKGADTAVVVDTATDSVTHTLTVGAQPYGVVMAPSGTFAYVANWGGGFGDTVSRIALSGGSSQYTATGFFLPAGPNDTVRTVKAGSTMPLKFRVTSSDDVVVSDREVVTSFAARRVDCEDLSPLGDPLAPLGVNALRFDAAKQQFVQNWQVPSVKGRCYSATVTIEGGSTVVGYFRAR